MLDVKAIIDYYLLIGIHDWISFNFNDTSAELSKFLPNSVNGKTLWHLSWQSAHINPWVSSRFLILKKFHLNFQFCHLQSMVWPFLYFYVISEFFGNVILRVQKGYSPYEEVWTKTIYFLLPPLKSTYIIYFLKDLKTPTGNLIVRNVSLNVHADSRNTGNVKVLRIPTKICWFLDIVFF